MLITFLSDFGLDDEFVGVCHGVIKRIAPEVEIIDVTHGIPPRRILQGALALANAVPYLPPGVHLAVVDPGVGSDRRGVALRAGDSFFVGPDNGLLLLAADRAGGVEVARELASPQYRLHPVSRTFHGRDVFAPAAAHLARGVSVADLGPALEPASLVRIEIPRPEIADGDLAATVLATDRFGNLHLNAGRSELEEAGLATVAALLLDAGGTRAEAALAETFADGQPDQALVYADSSGRLAIAVAGGNAAQRLSLHAGDRVRLGAARP